MSEDDPSNNPSKRVATKVKAPLLLNPLFSIACTAIVVLIVGGTYFSGKIQLMLGVQELKKDNQEAKAIDFFNWAISSNPSLAEAYWQRANAKLIIEQRKGLKANYSGPQSDIARAIKLAPSNNDIYATRLKIEEAAHNFRIAIAGYSHLIHSNDKDLKSYLNKRAGHYYIVSDYQKERADRERIIKIDTVQLGDSSRRAKSSLFEERASQYVFLGEYDKAIADYDACFQKDHDPENLLRIGYLYEHSERPSQAIKTYSQLINMAGKAEQFEVDEARFRRANLYLKAGENEKALADSEQLLKSVKSDMHHAFHIRILDALHRDVAAQAERKTVVDNLTFVVEDVFKDASNELLAGRYVERAKFYAADQQWQKALKDYSIAITLYPTSSAYIGCAEMYTKLGAYDKAIEFIRKALSPDSQDFEREKAYCRLAEVHLLQHQPELAVEDCNNAIMQGAAQGDGSYWRAQAYRQLGKKDLAKIDEQEALGERNAQGLGFSLVLDLNNTDHL